MLFDTHAHLDSSKYKKDVDNVIDRARDNNIKYILNPSFDLGSCISALNLAKKHDNYYCSLGFHPHYADRYDEESKNVIRELSKDDKVVAIGEIGLDFFRNLSPKHIQEKVFIDQIHLAKEINLPIIIHDRDANQRTFDLLCNEDAFDLGVLMHCYSGSSELAKEYVKKGALLSIAGPVTYKNNQKTQKVVKEIGIENLVIETDAPYLTPEPHRGKRNEPSYVMHVAAYIAGIKNMSIEEVGYITTDNALKFFGIS